jgi:hypothetical protein
MKNSPVHNSLSKLEQNFSCPTIRSVDISGQPSRDHNSNLQEEEKRERTPLKKEQN